MGEVGILVGEHGDTHFEMVQEESDQQQGSDIGWLKGDDGEK